MATTIPPSRPKRSALMVTVRLMALRIVNQVQGVMCQMCAERPVEYYTAWLDGGDVEMYSYCSDAFPDNLVYLECWTSLSQEAPHLLTGTSGVSQIRRGPSPQDRPFALG